MIYSIRGTISRQKKQSVQVPQRYSLGEITVPPGAYNITDLNLEIKRLMKLKGDADDKMTIQPNYNTLKSRVIVGNGYKVGFTLERGLQDLTARPSMLEHTTATDKSISPISTRY